MPAEETKAPEKTEAREPMSAEAYVEATKATGSQCPYCGAGQIEGHGMDFEAGAIYQKMDCGACGEDWMDIYTLTGYFD